MVPFSINVDVGGQTAMEPKERLSDLIMYLSLNDQEFFSMYGFPREKLFAIYRKVPNMDDREIVSICKRLLINEDYIYGRSASLVPTKPINLQFKRKLETNGYSIEQNSIANYHIKPFLEKVIQSEGDYYMFKGVKPSRLRGYMKNGLMLNDDEIEIIINQLHLNPRWVYQIIEPVFIGLDEVDHDYLIKK